MICNLQKCYLSCEVYVVLMNILYLILWFSSFIIFCCYSGCDKLMLWSSGPLSEDHHYCILFYLCLIFKIMTTLCLFVGTKYIRIWQYFNFIYLHTLMIDTDRSYHQLLDTTVMISTFYLSTGQSPVRWHPTVLITYFILGWSITEYGAWHIFR